MASLFRNWRSLLRTARQRQDRATLDRRHVYILPTRSGLLFGLILLGMLLGAMNYTLSLGFVLVFWLGGLSVVAMLHTWRNLAHLVVTPGRVKPVFAGETAEFHFVLKEHHHRTRHAIGLQRGEDPPALDDVPADGEIDICLPVPASRRGWLKPGRISVFTQFPLGLFHAWGYVELDMACLVYPHPAPPGSLLPPTSLEAKSRGSHIAGGEEDFSGLRGYKLGDSMRRIDWKASAREQGLYTKEFQGEGQQVLWLSWDMTAGRDTEGRVSLLARWVLDAHDAGLAWGLQLPAVTLPPQSGDGHLHECLKALALLGSSDVF
ncbi:uncharacterized protein NMK_3383 [Novimethylophilus kurashikiensis]|uniref:DUF58 domain-containing protein n=1 Tax=Novimethylophilus kurashikiensis TaxID=1825523 RepID=A0A2R5FII7_9PROT|nr:DUF58 domain-containing protein [Novimethylophilus kurashikiensis]GBG15771.1 uncharacterized protein NMK_3383 [Novimethylophilus kurashikiensis]